MNVENPELKTLIVEICQEGLIKGTLSQPKMKSYEYVKAQIQLIEEAKAFYQIESFTKEQAFHQNVDPDALVEVLYEVSLNYKQVHLFTDRQERIVRISKKGKVHVTAKLNDKVLTARTHNTKKKHILPEGQPVDFLIHLGIMDEAGNVKHKWYDKFKQINRYLEFIEDSLKYIDSERPTIIDFGCGKSYLTFALYYYLVKVQGRKATIIGLDLKETVIHNLIQLTDELGYEGLEFRVGDIAMFDYKDPIDMVISLHACNLATDYALEKAVKWEAKVIMAVPCCHKEINGQIDGSKMPGVMNHGVLKERIAALMTDGLRAELLTSCGYETKVMEFIDMEHTPKNLMIRAIKKSEKSDRPSDDYYETINRYGLKPTLEKLLFKKE